MTVPHTSGTEETTMPECESVEKRSADSFRAWCAENGAPRKEDEAGNAVPLKQLEPLFTWVTSHVDMLQESANRDRGRTRVLERENIRLKELIDALVPASTLLRHLENSGAPSAESFTSFLPPGHLGSLKEIEERLSQAAATLKHSVKTGQVPKPVPQGAK